MAEKSSLVLACRLSKDGFPGLPIQLPGLPDRKDLTYSQEKALKIILFPFQVENP